MNMYDGHLAHNIQKQEITDYARRFPPAAEFRGNSKTTETEALKTTPDDGPDQNNPLSALRENVGSHDSNLAIQNRPILNSEQQTQCH